jgi:hypothetical protein
MRVVISYLKDRGWIIKTDLQLALLRVERFIGPKKRLYKSLGPFILECL